MYGIAFSSTFLGCKGMLNGSYPTLKAAQEKADELNGRAGFMIYEAVWLDADGTIVDEIAEEEES